MEEIEKFWKDLGSVGKRESRDSDSYYDTINPFSNVKSISDLDNRYFHFCKKFKNNKGFLNRMREEYESIRSVLSKVVNSEDDNGYKDSVVAVGISDNIKVIDRLLKIREKKGYKSAWVYYRAIEDCNKLTLEEFEYMGEKLRYKSYWAIAKYEEYIVSDKY